MTPERKRALQWFHDRGEVKIFPGQEGQPSAAMIGAMMRGGQVECDPASPWGAPLFRLTDKGRRMLHGDDA